jgi:hypothetical protein
MDVERGSPALYERLGAHASADLVVLLGAARQEWVEDVTAAIIDRFERRLTEEISGVRLEVAGLRTEMHDADNSLRQEIRTLRQEMRDGDAAIRQDLRDVETRLTKESLIGRHELLKWVFVFWVTQMMAMGGLVAAMLRLPA